MEAENYPPTEHPPVAVDAVLFTVDAGSLKTLLIIRDHEPFAGCRAIPGVFVLVDENIDDAVFRVLKDKGGISNIPYMEQLYTFGDKGRDPRGRVISISYLSLVNAGNIKLLETSSHAGWFDVNDLPPIAFDHEKILAYAIQRLRWKIEYSTAAFALLPEEFTLASVKHVYETILGKQFSSGNFWRRFLAKGILKETGNVETMPENKRVHRPGKLYRLDRKIGEIVSIF